MNALIKRCACVLLIALGGTAKGADPVDGRHYLALDPPRATQGGSRIEVIEFFYYGCPVCYESQPYITRWLANAATDVVLRRVPAADESGESFALTFYALEAIGELPRLHGPLYENQHFDDRRLNEEGKLLEWLAGNGVDANHFRKVRNSVETRKQVAAARNLFRTYDVRGVPSFAVDGRYLTSARLAGGVKEMVDVLDYLVRLRRRERGAK